MGVLEQQDGAVSLSFRIKCTLPATSLSRHGVVGALDVFHMYLCSSTHLVKVPPQLNSGVVVQVLHHNHAVGIECANWRSLPISIRTWSIAQGRVVIKMEVALQHALDIYMVLSEISKVHKDLGDTLSESVKGAAAMGGSTFTGAVAGALVGGPIGMIAGGAIGFAGGATYAAATTKTFKPLHKVLGEMSSEDKKKLVEAAKVIIQRRSINLAQQIVGKYGSEFARTFLIDVYNEFSGKKIG